MTQFTVPKPQDLQGQVLYSASGEEIGVIEGVYLDNVTRDAEWAAVRLAPDALALIPLTEATATRDGLRVDYDLDMVLQAPFQLTALDNEVTEDTEQMLYEYYSRGGAGNGSGPAVVTEAQDLLGTATDEAADVVDTAKDEAAAVAATAKDEAADVAALARDEAAEVAATAKEEAAQVASSAKEQAFDVVATAKDSAATVVDVAKDETAEVAEVVAAEAREMVETTRTELQSQAETQIQQITESLYRLAGQALALARGNAGQAGPLGELVGRTGHELQGVATGIEDRGSAGLLADAQRVVRQRPKAAIIGTAAAVVAGARLMGTPAGERLKEKIAPLKEQAIEAGKNVAEELKPIAQQRAEKVKAVAASAADQVKQEAQGSVEDVKGTAARSTQAVKGTAKESTAAVKGTAKSSTETVKGTAKKSARTAKAAAAGDGTSGIRVPPQPARAAQTAAGPAKRPPTGRGAPPRATRVAKPVP